MDETTRKLIDALRSDPSNVAHYQALKAHYLSLGDVASAANLIEGWAARESDPMRASSAYLEAARLVMSLPNEEERLLSLLELALTLNPLAEDARGFLENYYLVRNDVDGLVDSLERQRDHLARIDTDPRVLAELEYRLGELLGERLGRKDDALQRYRAAAEIDPSHVQALYAARMELLRRGEIQSAIALLEQEASAETDPDRKLALLLELEQRALHELHDPALAIQAGEKAIAIAPHDLELRHRLTSMLLERIERGEASARDEAVAVQLMLELAAASPSDAAIVYARNALRIDPGSVEALGIFEDAARDESARKELLEHYSRFLEIAPDEGLSNTRRKRYAELLLASGAPEAAAEALQPLIEAGDAEASLKLVAITDAHPGLRPPMLPRALALLTEGYLEGGRPDAAAIALERLFLVEKDLDERIAIAERLSKLATETLHDRELALRVLRAWTALDPTDLTPQIRLVPLLREEGLTDELLDILDTLSLDPMDGGQYALEAARLLFESGDAKASLFRLRDRASFDERCRDAMLEIARSSGLEALLPDEFREEAPSASGVPHSPLDGLSELIEDEAELIDEEDAHFEDEAELIDEEDAHFEDEAELIDEGDAHFEDAAELIEDAAELIDEDEATVIDHAVRSLGGDEASHQGSVEPPQAEPSAFDAARLGTADGGNARTSGTALLADAIARAAGEYGDEAGVSPAEETDHTEGDEPLLLEEEDFELIEAEGALDATDEDEDALTILDDDDLELIEEDEVGAPQDAPRLIEER